MSSVLADRFRQWFVLECKAHDRVFASLRTVPTDRHASPEFRKAVSLVGHVVAARRIWLARLGVIPLPTDPLFPEDSDLEKVIADWARVQSEWTPFLAGLDDAALARQIEYRSYDGDAFRNRVEDVLLQLLTHSPYHRGQIAVLVRACGGEPAKTDYIFWLREAVR